MTHSKWYFETILASGISEKSNNNIMKYHPTNHKIMVYSNKMKKFDMWTLPWKALWQLPLHIITAHAAAVGWLWCSWWQFSTFQCRIASLWIIWLRGYCDMERTTQNIMPPTPKGWGITMQSNHKYVHESFSPTLYNDHTRPRPNRITGQYLEENTNK